MKLFKDMFTGDEIFSDTYKMKLVDEVMYEVYGKLVTRKHGDIQIDGANPSAEEADEGTEEGVESGVDIVLNHRLQETFAFDKKGYMGYLKEYMKKVVERLQERNPDQVDVFKTNINKVMKDLLSRFKDLQFFTGESMDPDGLVVIIEYKDVDGDNIPIMYALKHGLDEEKL
ncbi:Translationally-controlled tumor protein [Orchesella cincta]|uniref:Translationally-controlled tumor protein homolog n=1 Tax=Orchesella cincta TaxID=48709 RepID=A0A1D2MJQ1_ORCCI|nr:Translationally-controlled tumor protein [Orchesella cincta]